jgi:hypothetical protein
MANQNVFTTPVKPKKPEGAARVIGEIDVPMSDGQLYEVKLVSGTGASKKHPARFVAPTVAVNRGGVKVVIDADTYDGKEPLWDAPEAPAAPAPAPAPAPEPEKVEPSVDVKEVTSDVAQVAIMEAETVAELDAMEEAERDGKGRKSVLRAIADRRAELDG